MSHVRRLDVQVVLWLADGVGGASGISAYLGFWWILAHAALCLLGSFVLSSYIFLRHEADLQREKKKQCYWKTSCWCCYTSSSQSLSTQTTSNAAQQGKQATSTSSNSLSNLFSSSQRWSTCLSTSKSRFAGFRQLHHQAQCRRPKICKLRFTTKN